MKNKTIRKHMFSISLAFAAIILSVSVDLVCGQVVENVNPAPATANPVAAPGQPIEFQIPAGGQWREQLGGRTGGRLGRRLGERVQRFGNGEIGNRLRDAEVDLSQPRARMVIQGLDYLLGPEVRLGVSPDSSGIDVSISPQAITNGVNAVRGNVQGLVEEDANYGLTILPETADQEKRLVVLVHGFNSSPTRMVHVGRSLTNNGHRVATFHYATANGVDAAAQSLSLHLNGWAERTPEYRITLVTHSMGGVCARGMLESTELDCDAVDRLVMVAPPNHGSELARIGLLEEPLQNAATGVDRPQISRLISRIAGQVNAAIGDMRPASPILSRLNAKSRNERVEYSILLGNQAPISEKQALVLSELISGLGGEVPAVELMGQQAADTLEQVSEEVVGRAGDGVVSVASGKLAGVTDVKVLGFQHNDLLNADSEGWRLLEPEILQRLRPAKKKSEENKFEENKEVLSKDE